MKLEPIHRAEVLLALVRNGTRQAKVEQIEKKLCGGGARVASDGTWTVLICGTRVGIAKRARYARMHDDANPDVGLSIAASRL